MTLVRIRGEMVLWVAVATAVGDGFTKGAAGIGIVTNDAFAIGATAMPGPFTDPEWNGWIWYQSLAAIVSLETTEVARGPMGAVRIPIDTKAMRKLNANDTVFGAVELSTEVGTTTINFTMNTRMLSKLF